MRCSQCPFKSLQILHSPFTFEKFDETPIATKAGIEKAGPQLSSDAEEKFRRTTRAIAFQNFSHLNHLPQKGREKVVVPSCTFELDPHRSF